MAKHIAIYGCGQLAQMMAQAGQTLGLEFSFIAERGEDKRCVKDLGKVVTYTENMSAEELYQALGQPDIITVEKEMVDTALLRHFESLCAVHPSSNSVHITQNRVREKQFVRQNGINTAEFVVIDSAEQLSTICAEFGYPVFVKAAESGYDGYNQWHIKSAQDCQDESLLAAIKAGTELIAEKRVDYRREVSIIAARNEQGDVSLYPLMDNRHEEGVLLTTIVPAPEQSEQISEQAQQAMESLLNALGYVGILTIECFDTEEGLLVNELAPRVHNSGHWSIEGCETSQFENHIRAIAAMPLGDTSMTGVAGMVNMLGKHGDSQQLSADDLFYHDYGKTERARRKLGHITATSEDYKHLKQRMNHALTSLYQDKYKPL